MVSGTKTGHSGRGGAAGKPALGRDLGRLPSELSSGGCKGINKPQRERRRELLRLRQEQVQRPWGGREMCKLLDAGGGPAVRIN